uniref:Uncharacterized protein n=2 Tax=Chrysotila carterae TaxID=13221 RepID=A0A7S4B5W6_CHRCT
MHNEIRRDSWSELLFASENDNRSFSQKKALSSSMLESLLRNPCAPVISQATAVGRAKLASRYLIHEKLLLAFYTRNSRSTARPVHWLSDPLAKWRDHWRVFGLVLMLLNCMAITSAAWARFRCEINESCHEELDSCPPMITWLSKFHLPSLNLWQCKSFNCRRQVISVLSGRATQLFALSELSLGLRTAATASLYPRHAVGTHVAEAVQYGTTAGATAYALATLDLMLSLPWHASAESVPRTPPPPSTPWHALVDPLRRKLAESRPVRTLVGYRRLKALPPPPTLLGWLLDEWILPAWLGTGQEAVVNFVKALPAIGDAILEAELLQAWFASFLASAKMLVRHRLDAAPVDNPVHPSRCKFCEVPCVSSRHT